MMTKDLSRKIFRRMMGGHSFVVRELTEAHGRQATQNALILLEILQIVEFADDRRIVSMKQDLSAHRKVEALRSLI